MSIEDTLLSDNLNPLTTDVFEWAEKAAVDYSKKLDILTACAPCTLLSTCP